MQNMTHLITLLADDSAYKSLCLYCQNQSLIIRSTSDPDQFLEAVMKERPSVVIFDLRLTGSFGLDLTRDIHEISFHTRVMVLLADYSVGMRLQAFSSGVDDIMASPYHPRECFLRLERLSRLRKIFATRPYQLAQNLSFIPANAMIKTDQEKIYLRRRESQILACLVEHRRQIVSRLQLAKWLWGDDSLSSMSTIDVYVKRLRDALRDKAFLVKTVRGLGYTLGEQAMVDS